MKKTLVALAALAATGAFAQSSVQIDGVLDAGYISYNYNGNTVAGADSNLTYTSQINFRGTNDLGGGMHGTWHMENDWKPLSGAANNNSASAQTSGYTNTSSWLNGEMRLGVDGGWGSFDFGSINNYALSASVTLQPFGTATGSGFKQTGGALFVAPVRDDNTMRYMTPNMSGFQVGLIARKQQTGFTAAQAVTATTVAYGGTTNGALGNQGESRSWQLGATYNAGPWNAIAVYAVDDARNVGYANNALNKFIVATQMGGTLAAGNTLVSSLNSNAASGAVGTYKAFGGNYNLGAATVFAGYQSNGLTDGNTTGTINAINVGATYVMGANKFMANIASEKIGGAFAVSASTTSVGLGYEYALSKTTALTARYNRITDSIGVTYSGNDPLSTLPGQNLSYSKMGAGIRVGF